MSSRSSAASGHHGARGFGLIEVLVALVVLSIGLLGTAKLQVLAIRYNTQSFMRSQAAALAYDMADRMRANPTAVAAGSYDSADAANYQPPADNGCSETASSAAQACTAAQLAAHDAWEWGNEISNALPAGAGTVCTDSDPDDAVACDGIGNVYSITVSWTEMVDGAPSTASYRMRVEP